MDTNSCQQQDSLTLENNYDTDSFYDMLNELPPLDSLLDMEDLKPNDGFHHNFQHNNFEDFFENIEALELYISGESSLPLANQNDFKSSNQKCEKRTVKRNFKKKRQDKLEMSEIKLFFDRPIIKAAKDLNIGLTVLKKRCRELGLYRWPHRKIKSLNSLINNLKSVGMDEEVKNLEEHRVLMEKEPDAELTDGTKKLRQACFKANYKKRKSLC